MVGILRSLATGPTANISLDRVGPMIVTTLSRPISLRAALIAWSLLAADILDRQRDLLAAQTTPFWLMSSSARSRPALMATP